VDVGAPNLYRAEIELHAAGEVVDADSVTFGIRTVRADPKRGLRINGRTVKLRGACIHHDNGVLGAAAIGRAEERRVEILKQAGFNAIRSAHNPISSAMLDACDRLGMLVMDETFDSWNSPKMEFDYAISFGDWWERDVEALVAKNYNHPSVIFYSIGNEIHETGSPFGAIVGRRLAEKLRALDSTRLITNGVNALVAIMDSFVGMIGGADKNINEMMEEIGPMMQQVATSELATTRTEESQALLDVAGMNYAEARYAIDRELFPHRMIVGTETAPSQMAEIWALVEKYDHVIGDFTWTGWDYLGEAGIGKIAYRGEVGAGQWGGAYPWLAGGIGDIDLIGQRTPASYYREVSYGLGAGPYIAVHRPVPADRSLMTNQWSVGDVHANWNWDGLEGTPTRVDVYARAEEVELLLNGKSLGRVKVGAQKPYLATFQTAYAPGKLEAVAYADGREAGRQMISTAGNTFQLHAKADRALIRADFRDLAYVDICLTDELGVLQAGRDRAVTVEVSGPAHLQGLGSANPISEESFASDTCTTYHGRALAIMRPTGPGEIGILVRADGCETVRLRVVAVALEKASQ
jgi:beta-galactosidase